MGLIRRLIYLFRQRGLEAELAEELNFHREMRERELEASGMSRSEAVRAARRALGNVTLAREDSRSTWIWPWLESVWQDGAYAMRALRKQPGFTLVSVLVLGAAIGLNASLFTVFAGIVFRPWAGMAEPGRVVKIAQQNPIAVGRGEPVGLSVAEYRYLAQHTKSLAGLATLRPMLVRLGTEGVGRSTDLGLVSANYFDVLGVRLERGRGFRSDEDTHESPAAVAVLTYGFWQSRFAADPDIVGKTLSINGVTFTIVGVAAKEFVGPDHGSLWVPLSSLLLLNPRDPFVIGLLTRATDCCVNVAGRLVRGVSRDEAAAELTVVSNQFRASSGMTERPILVSGTEFIDWRRPGRRAGLLGAMALLAAALVLVLIVACANVGNLLLARAAARAREIGVRMSLGASRLRVVRQLLTEGFVLATLASAIGLALAFRLPPIVMEIVAGDPRPVDITPDALVIAYAIVLAAGSCVFFALAPALHATRRGPLHALKDAPFRLRSRWSLRSVLLATQVAISVVLLVGAGLLGRGIAHARLLDLGFSIDDVGVAVVELPQNAYDAAHLRALVADLTTSLQSSPAVPFAFASNEPFGDSTSTTALRLPKESEQEAHAIEFLTISSGYFDVLRIPIVAGRNFESADASRRVALVNEATARRFWPDQSPVGQSFYGGGHDLIEVIGVAKDAQTDGFDDVEPKFYRPFEAMSPSGGHVEDAPRILFRSSAPAADAAIAAIVRSLDSRARTEVRPLASNIDRSVADRSVGPRMAAILGIFALALAAVGMFGVFGYAVRQRTKEIGIRIALGARPAEVVRLVLAANSRAVAAGLVVGFGGAMAASQVLRSFLHGLSPFDSITYAVVALLLFAAGVAASYGPARKATRVDPMTALRYE